MKQGTLGYEPHLMLKIILPLLIIIQKIKITIKEKKLEKISYYIAWVVGEMELTSSYVPVVSSGLEQLLTAL